MQYIDGAIIKQYRITQRLARGGMGEIYLAEDMRTGQTVAVKAVRSANADYFERFRREIKTIASLQHEHILPALDYGEHDDWCYMVSPYIKYGTLASLLAHGGPMTLEHAGEILEQLADALQCAHNHGIVHRDIKPSNVLLRDEHFAYLADFGLVKGLGADHSLTQSGFLIGTPEYIAPELVESPPTTASDTYALGIMLYQMLTARVPFRGANPVSIVWKHLRDLPPPPSRFNSAIPYPVEQVIMHALEKDPQKRFQTPRELSRAYQRALGKEEPALPPTALKAPPPVEIEIIPVTPSTPGLSWQSLANSHKAALIAVIATLVVVVALCGIAIL